VEEAELLRTRVLPGTERAVAALRRGYEGRRFAQLEVLDAERARLGREQYRARSSRRIQRTASNA
jgi:hypothetical protein